jgi:hypothetical protein
MNRNLVEAYSYYKEKYAPFIIFFRIGNECRAYFDDAKLLNQIVGASLIDGYVTYPYDDILDVVSEIYYYNISAKVISYKTPSGQYGIPDINEIINGEKEDF